MDSFLDQLMALATSQGWGVAAGVLIGMFGPRAAARLRPIVARTPTPIDDMALSAVEALCARHAPEIASMTAAELDKIVSTPVLVELVKLRKARINAAKAPQA